MEDGRKHIDDLFREGLEGYREMPEPAVWNAIEQRLPKQDGRKRFLWLWGLLLLALLSSLGYYGLKNLGGDVKENTAQEEKVISERSSSDTEPAPVTAVDNLPDNPTLSKEGKEPVTASANQPADVSTHNSTAQTLSNADKTATGISPTRQQEHAKAITGNNSDRSTPSSSNTYQEEKKGTSSAAENKDLPTGTNKNTIARNKPAQAVLPQETPGTKVTPVPFAVASKQNATEDQTVTNKSAKSNDNQDNKISGSSSPKLQPDAEAKAATGKTKKETNNPAVVSLQEDKKEKQATIARGAEPQTGNTSPVLQEPPSKAGATTNKMASNVGASKPDLKNDLSNTPGKTTAAQAENSRSVSSFVKLQEDKKPGSEERNKNVRIDPKPQSNAPATTAKPVVLTHEKSTDQPIAVEGEKSKGAPVTLNDEKSSPKPILVNPAPNAKVPATNESGKVSKPNPLTIEAPREYGIKVSAYETAHDDEEEGETGSPVSGGGGAGDGISKNDKQRGGKKSVVGGGLKIGYDRGFASVTTSNLVGNVFLQWNISPKVALTLQPGIRYHAINKTQLFPQQSFHDITSASWDSAHVTSVDSSGGVPQTVIQRNFIYRNTYDSINLSYKLDPQRYVEIELPLLLQYKLAENLSVLLGGQLSFGKVIQIAGSTSRIQGLSKVDTVSYGKVPIFDTTPVNPPGLTDYFTYNTSSIESFDGNKYNNPVTNPARFGLMLGFSYEVRKRLLIDLMARKNISNLNFIPNESVRKIYNQPYFRITIGYKLF